MKKRYLFFAFVILTLLGCNKETDLSGIEQELADLRNKNKELQNEIDDMKKPIPADPVLEYLNFLAQDNPSQLSADVKGEIIGDSIVECWVPHIMSDKELVADLKFVGEQVKFNNSSVQSRSTKYDFKKPVKLTITNQTKSKEYTVYVHAFTGLPVLWINTVNREPIASREEYVEASFKLVEDVRTRAAGDVIETSMLIKGRGNSNWSSPKKPYRLKLETEYPLFGLHKDKAWVLMGNYFDKTMLRTNTAFYMGSISNLDYTPKAHYVELMLNGRYHGTYMLCEKLKRSKHRVDVGDDGFLLEVDAVAKADDVTFRTNHLKHPINIKSPSVEAGDDDYNYIRNFVLKAESALFSVLSVVGLTVMARSGMKQISIPIVTNAVIPNIIATPIINGVSCFFVPALSSALLAKKNLIAKIFMLVRIESVSWSMNSARAMAISSSVFLI